MTNEEARRLGRGLGRAFGQFLGPWTLGAIIGGIGIGIVLAGQASWVSVALMVLGAAVMWWSIRRLKSDVDEAES